VINEDLLDTNTYYVDKQMWAGILNHRDTIDFNDLRALEEKYRRTYRVPATDSTMKRAMIREAARRYMLVQAARAIRIDTIDIVRAEEQALRSKYGRIITEADRTDIGWNPPDSLVQQYFDQHRDQFQVDKPLRVQHIIVEDSVFGEFLRDQAESGIDFLELARQYYPGEESVRADLADMGDIGPRDVPEPFYEAAAHTGVGHVSHPVRTQYGFHIIKLLERRHNMTAEGARHKIVPVLKQRHAAEVFRKYRDRLYSKFDVEFPKKLPSVMLGPRESRVEPGDG